jgi:hypothetical protein
MTVSELQSFLDHCPPWAEVVIEFDPDADRPEGYDEAQAYLRGEAAEISQGENLPARKSTDPVVVIA